MTIELAEGRTIGAALAVAADGRASIARTAAGIATRSWSYGQTAIAATFRHSRPHAGITTELHRRAGPLTTVPLPGNASSLVWVEEPAVAARLAALDDAAFLAELAARLQGLLGSLSDVGPRAVLSAFAASAPCAWARAASPWSVSPRTSFRRSARKGSTSACAMRRPLPSASPLPARGVRTSAAHATLEAYHAARAADVLGRTISVDLLNRSLLSDFLPVQALRGLGLHLLANVGPLRRLVMRGGMEAPGRLPRLMQPGGLARLSP